MTRRGACAPRRLLARTLSVERFEERWLLCTIGPALDPPGKGWAVATSPIAPFVSQISARALTPPPAANGIGEMVPVDGGAGFGLVGRAPVTAPPSPLLDHLVAPLVGIAKPVGPSGSIALATGSSVA